MEGRVVDVRHNSSLLSDIGQNAIDILVAIYGVVRVGLAIQHFVTAGLVCTLSFLGMSLRFLALVSQERLLIQ